MNDRHSERMDAMSEAIIRLLRRQEESERRLARIEEALGLARVETPAPAEPAPPPAEPEPPAPVLEPQPAPAEPVAPSTGLETRLGLSWINRIGALTLILAAAFFFKYAVDNQWIGPAGRVLLGALAGVGALAAADRLWSRGHQVYAQGICGAGVAILYLSYYAAFGFYRLVPVGFAFVLMVSATAMAGALALRYSAPAIAALGLVGGYATPVLLSTGEDRPWVLFSYVWLLNAGALGVARYRSWRKLEALAMAGTLALYGAWFADRFKPEKQTVAAVFAALFYAQFAISSERWIFLVAQAAAALIVPAIWERSLPGFTLGALALAAVGLVIADRRRWAVAPTVTFAAFWTSYALWSESQRQLPVGPLLLFFTAAFLLFLAWTPRRILLLRAEPTREDLLLLALNGSAYFTASYFLLEPRYHDWVGLFTVALAAVHFAVGWNLWHEMPEERRDPRPVVLAAAIALVLATLAAPIQFTSYRITMAWSAQAALLVWVAMRTNMPRLAWAGLAVFALVIGRLLVVDSWIYRTATEYRVVANARFLTFLTAAAALLAAAGWLRSGARALASYLAGHFVLLWGLSLETTGWARRTVQAETLRSVESAALSILWAIYAVALVAAGALTRSAVNRIIGLGLIGLVVAKLYLYDVWSMVKIHRVIAFTALGGLLLLTSYVYSRYRASIEAWWKNEKDGS